MIPGAGMPSVANDSDGTVTLPSWMEEQHGSEPWSW